MSLLHGVSLLVFLLCFTINACCYEASDSFVMNSEYIKVRGLLVLTFVYEIRDDVIVRMTLCSI
jgi:hypothetical protein